MKTNDKWIAGTVFAALVIFMLSPGALRLWENPTFWEFRNQLVFFTGIVAFALMTLAMVISIRPKWLDFAMNGLDKAYPVHKWAGIFTLIAATIHYLAEKLPQVFVVSGWMAHPGNLAVREFSPFEITLIQSGVVTGYFACYLLVILTILALVNKVPYRIFRYGHKIFPLVYLALAYHALTTAIKGDWWLSPAGYVLAAITLIGCYAAIISLLQLIGASRKVDAVITQADIHDNGIIDLCLETKGKLFFHEPGQFVFLSFAHNREPHPFTIASSGNDPEKMRFSIKALGDFTKKLAGAVTVGETVTVEGPYGQFKFDRPGNRQVWVAGGIGITPFMAQLEHLNQKGGAKQPIDLWYCTTTNQDSLFPEGLEALCEKSGVTLHRLNAEKNQFLNADIIQNTLGTLQKTNIWFCGPQKFAQSLLKGLSHYGFDKSAFHFDNFNMR